MKQLRVTPEAKGDLADIWWYIAQDSERAADAIIDKLTQKFDELVVTPGIGRARADLAPQLRSIPVENTSFFIALFVKVLRLCELFTAPEILKVSLRNHEEHAQ
ncbi:MAG: type II toxin-antitoxin system RelE/ParE family toxin [Nostoc sp. DedQUE12a]|nr:type II toxin-antitoxin system RelE/ParE family toxin [Nostoc sp. DedQUE12a]